MLRRWFVAGLLVWVPLGVTIFIMGFLVRLFNSSLLLLPARYDPQRWLGFPLPGLGVVLGLVVVLVTGFLAANIAGRRVLALIESLLERIPLVRSVYGGVKRLTESVFADDNESFRRVLLVEYPRRDMWTLAFQTGTTVSEVQSRTAKDVITVYIPTTPNPTSGFVVMLPREDVIPLDMSVEDGLRMIISMGVVGPDSAAPVEVRGLKT